MLKLVLLHSALLLSSQPIEPATGAVSPASDEQEVVVTARRTGVPVWNVTGPQGTLVLVGTINWVAPGTPWDPVSLTDAVRQADRVLFLNSVEPKISLGDAVGQYLKFRRRAALPKGQSLKQLLTPEEFTRLVELQRRGLLKPGFERRNPMHLTLELRRRVLAGFKGGSTATATVAAAARTYKVRTVPVPTVKANPVLQTLLDQPPSALAPCLVEAVALAEAGAAGLKARSEAWTQRQVPKTLRLPMADFPFCAPPTVRAGMRPDLRPTVRRLVTEPGSTVAVLDLRALAQPGGVLDDLVQAGHRPHGPAWR